MRKATHILLMLLALVMTSAAQDDAEEGCTSDELSSRQSGAGAVSVAGFRA